MNYISLTPKDNALLKSQYRPIINVIESLWKVAAEDFLSKSHKTKNVTCRHFLHKLFFDLGLSKSDIGKLRGLPHSTIISSIQKADDLLSAYPQDAALYEAAKMAAGALQIVSELNDEHYNKIVYIAGKISDLDTDITRAKFISAENKLKSAKEVINPFKFCEEKGITGWTNCMKVLIPEVLRSNLIVALPDYQNSRGAIWEINIAHNICNIPIMVMK